MRAGDMLGGDVFSLFGPEFADEGRFGRVVGARGGRRDDSGLMVQGGSGNRGLLSEAAGASGPALARSPFRGELGENLPGTLQRRKGVRDVARGRGG